MQSLPDPTQRSWKIGTDDCDNERHAGATQYFVIRDNKLNKYQEEFLLLGL